MVGLVFGAVSGATKMDMESMSPVLIFVMILLLAFYLWVPMFVIRRLMTKGFGFGRYQLVILVK